MARPVNQTGKAIVLTDKQLMTILKQLSPHASSSVRSRNKALMVISFKLGLRAKEMAALKIADVFDGSDIKSVLRLYAKYTKNNKHRDLPLTNKVVRDFLGKYIEFRQEQDGLSFNVQAPLFRSQKGSSFSPNAMSRVFKEIYAECGVDGASSHSGRRTLLTNLANSGVSAFHLRDIAGHSSIQTTQGYVESNINVIGDVLKSA